MADSLFSELVRIGIDKEVAHKISASLEPDYNASKKDVLVMQEAIMKVQLQSEHSYNNLCSEIHDVRSEIIDVRSDLHAINRQFIIAFGGMLVTIATVVTVNWYFH